jgi:5'-3' exonuclease
MKRPALVVDGLSVFHSVAGPAAFLTNGYIYSFVVQLTSVVKRFGPEGIFVCWDRDSKMRQELHPGYKAQRVSSMNADKHKMLADVRRFLKAVGASQLHAEGHEADDIGAFLANTLENVILVSNDKDWLQLVRPGVSVWTRCRVAGKKQEKKLVTADNFSDLTGWRSPEELVLGLCAMGDAVDGIDGLPGIGDVTIKKFLMGMGVGPATDQRLRAFFAGDPLYLRNKALIDLRDVREIPGLEAHVDEFSEQSVKSLLEEFMFASMLKKFPEWVRPYKEASENLSPIS